MGTTLVTTVNKEKQYILTKGSACQITLRGQMYTVY